MADSSSSKKVWKYIGCGCLLVVVAALLAIGGCAWWLNNKTRELVNEFTATDPVELPSVTMPDEQVAELRTRLVDFQTAVENDRSAEIELTADDLNAWVSQTDLVPELKDKVYFEIEGQELQAQVSVPLNFLGEIPFLKYARDRYFNGDLGLRVVMEPIGPAVYIQSLTVNGISPPDEVLNELSKQDILTEMRKNNRDVDLSNLKRIEVADGKLIIETVGQAVPAPTPVEVPAPAPEAVPVPAPAP